MMGVWYMSNFFGNYLTGYLGTFYEKMAHGSFFTMLGGFGVAAGVVMFLMGKPLKNAVGHNN